MSSSDTPNFAPELEKFDKLRELRAKADNLTADIEASNGRLNALIRDVDIYEHVSLDMEGVITRGAEKIAITKALNVMRQEMAVERDTAIGLIYELEHVKHQIRALRQAMEL